MIVHFIVGLIEKTESNDCIKMSQYEPYEPFGGDISLKLTCLFMQQNRYEIYIACWYFKFCIKIKCSYFKNRSR